MDGIFLTLPIVIIGLLLFLYFVPLGLWIQSGVSIGWGKIGMVKLVIMRIRKIPPKLMADGIINLHRAGLDFVTSEELETHFLAGGNVQNVVDALIAADKANIELDFKTATAIDVHGIESPLLIIFENSAFALFLLVCKLSSSKINALIPYSFFNHSISSQT